jgi:hypothetical protein
VPLFLFIGLEEGLKAFASRLSNSPRQALALVLLMGVWELLLTKGILPWVSDLSLTIIVDKNQIVYFALVGSPVFMHAVTAAIYAIGFSDKWWKPYLLSFTIHMVFNLTRDIYIGNDGSINSWFIILDVLAFAISGNILWRVASRRKIVLAPRRGQCTE